MNIFYLILATVIVVSLISFISLSIYWKMIDLDEIGMSIGFGVIAGVITALLVLIYAFSADGESYKSETYEISAIKDNSNVSGRSYLGTGYVNESQYYFYILETEKGKKMNKVHIGDAYLNEGDYTPYVDVYDYKYKSKFAQWLYGKNKYDDYEFVFFIPEDTVTTEFNVDME